MADMYLIPNAGRLVPHPNAPRTYLPAGEVSRVRGFRIYWLRRIAAGDVRLATADEVRAATPARDTAPAAPEGVEGENTIDGAEDGEDGAEDGEDGAEDGEDGAEDGAEDGE